MSILISALRIYVIIAVILFMEYSGERFAAPCFCIPFRLCHSIIDIKPFNVLCFDMYVGQAYNIGSITRIPAVLSSSPCFVPILAEFLCKVTFKTCALLFTIDCQSQSAPLHTEEFLSTCRNPAIHPACVPFVRDTYFGVQHN